MKIAMIGTGYVGLVSGVCFSDFGHDVVCVDKDPAKIAKLNAGIVPIFEPGLDALMVKNVEAGRLRFTQDLADAVQGADAVFIAVGTPTRRGDGHADLSYVHAAAEDVARAATDYVVIVTKSTVPVGTNRHIKQLIRKANPDLEFDVASNPEFLREGAAIEDFMKPDRVVVGVQSERAAEVMAGIYRPLYLRDFPIVTTDLESAEMIKYAANAFLATKITFINEIAALCERVGGDIKEVARGIGLDGRIGNKFLHAGPGYGGSCFPKDTVALARIGQDHSIPMQITETVIKVNDEIKRRMIDKLLDLCGGSFNGKTVTVLGATFKPNTDDMRDAPSLTIIPAMVGGGAKVRVVDPQGRREGEALLPGVNWQEDVYKAAQNADLLVLLTEWNEFRALDLKRIARKMATPRMADLRNVYAPKDARQAGFVAYASVGRQGFTEEDN
ncbi:MAG: UDP-glucose/GDP-mannose dehydrogenase family protein [Rhodobacterales bacterium]|jgi:UDPglucose 6-dehydrogenase|nr:UDP-glucose/GDP-mannose dehydrogenase family protein [Rhodobacterales bacterium]MDX5390974.1 UDP-glucose/GDP-mannose dehydrogenase family protein [Rhodobacterales bacterium]MDX5490669.1 UDP-glucose/GDP-mannose dehydrogenase family protein [Rhodobacterales bacterium]